MNDTITRKGMTTSEFRLVLLFFAVVLANGTRYIDIPVEQMTMLATLAFGYGGGRLMLKNTMAKGANP